MENFLTWRGWDAVWFALFFLWIPIVVGLLILRSELHTWRMHRLTEERNAWIRERQRAYGLNEGARKTWAYGWKAQWALTSDIPWDTMVCRMWNEEKRSHGKI